MENHYDEVFKSMISLRDLVNEPRISYGLKQEIARWFKLCSSMDVIEDTCQAINEFINLSSSQQDIAFIYLACYGVLQALFVQQDAVSSLCNALNIEISIKDIPELSLIRDVRNDSTGHPTDRKHGESFHGISQATLSMAGFQLLSQDSNGNTNFKDIELLDLIDKQESIMKGVLNRVVEEVEERDKKNKEDHKSENLVTPFSGNIEYDLGKLIECTYTDDYLNLGGAMIKKLKESMEEFESLLLRRGLGINAYPGVKDTFSELKYPMEILEEYFHTGMFSAESSENSKKTGYIFARYVREKMLELKQIASEIDEEYSS